METTKLERPRPVKKSAIDLYDSFIQEAPIYDGIDMDLHDIDQRLVNQDTLDLILEIEGRIPEYMNVKGE